MRIKKFVAATMAEAMVQVRSEFGNEAVILHTKRRNRPRWLRFILPSRVEVIAALEPSRPKGKTQRPVRPVRPDGNEGPPTFAQALELEYAALPKTTGPETSVVEVGPATDPLVHSFYLKLLDQEVEERIAAGIVRESTTDLSGPIDPSNLSRRVRQTVANLIRTSDIWTDGKRRVVALVGPTGVGKTTTIAKLAANYSLLSGKQVGLVTIDTYRIAAVEQLKTYADIITVPISVAYTPQELAEALEAHRDKDLILIDTAGRSARNQMQMQELRAFMNVAKPDEIHLVLSATTRNRDLDEVVQRFAVVGYNRLIVTKLDESTSYGCLINLAVKTGKPISYLTDGQQVPDDIEAVDPLKISDLILGGVPGD